MVYEDGHVRVDDRRLRRQKMGIIFQSYNLIPFLTALENVALILTLDDVPVREAFRRAVEPHPAASVLDLGCGPGTDLAWFTERYPGRRYAGIDVSPRMVELARARLAGRGVRIDRGCAEDIPRVFPGEQFDLVYSFFGPLNTEPDLARAALALAQAVAPLAHLGRRGSSGGRLGDAHSPPPTRMRGLSSAYSRSAPRLAKVKIAPTVSTPACSVGKSFLLAAVKMRPPMPW